MRAAKIGVPLVVAKFDMQLILVMIGKMYIWPSHVLPALLEYRCGLVWASVIRNKVSL